MPLGDSMIEIIRAAKLAGLVGDVQTLNPYSTGAAAGSSGRYADAAHIHPADFGRNSGSIAAFQGTAAGIAMLRADGTLGRWTALDFTEGGNLVTARLAALFTNSGTSLSLGTSNSFVAGITNNGLTVDPNGNVLVNEAANQTNSTLEVNSNQNMAGIMVNLPNATPWAQIWRRNDAGGGDLRLFNALSGTSGQGVWQFFSGPNLVASIDNLGDLTLPVASATLKFVDSSGTPNKWLRAIGGALVFLNNAFTQIAAIDDAGNLTAKASLISGALQLFNGTDSKYLQDSGTAFVMSNNALTHQIFKVTDAGVAVANPEGQNLTTVGLQVHSSGGVIPAIYVQAATPTEIDGALWFQG